MDVIKNNPFFFKWSLFGFLPALLIHTGLTYYFAPEQSSFVFRFWGFLFVVTVGLLLGIEIIIRKKQYILGFAFLASILIKIVLSVVFLYPLIQISKQTDSLQILHFFIPCFSF